MNKEAEKESVVVIISRKKPFGARQPSEVQTARFVNRPKRGTGARTLITRRGQLPVYDTPNARRP